MDDALKGRGHRRRSVVSYNDGLDDYAWAMVMVLIAITGEEVRPESRPSSFERNDCMRKY